MYSEHTEPIIWAVQQTDRSMSFVPATTTDASSGNALQTAATSLEASFYLVLQEDNVGI